MEGKMMQVNVNVEDPTKFKIGPKFGTLSAMKRTAIIIAVRTRTRLVPNSKMSKFK
jgi:hypothetical protein